MDRRSFVVGSAGLAFYAPSIFLLSAPASREARASEEAQGARRTSITAWEQRIRDILERGRLPIIDMQATYVAGKTDVSYVVEQMNELDVAQIAFATANARKSDPSLQLHRKYPAHFIPATNSGEFKRWWKNPQKFVSGVASDLDTGLYFLMGEHEFRHYPSPEQVKAGRSDRDITVKLDGPAGHALFKLSEKTGVAFQIHYEIEDRLLPVLESMLARYPKAKLIWCHLAMIRYPDRAINYRPEFIASLIEKFPGLHFDLAVPPARHIYKPSGARDSTLFEQSGEVNSSWRAVIEKYPERFLAASDYRPQIESKFSSNIQRQRELIDALIPQARSLVAYQNAWRLITGSPWS